MYAPERVRGGLFYEARFGIDAIREVSEATLVLDSGWAEESINTVEPAPIGEASRNGRLAFELGRIPAGQKHVFFLQLQVNPTHVGHRSQGRRALRRRRAARRNRPHDHDLALMDIVTSEQSSSSSSSGS